MKVWKVIKENNDSDSEVVFKGSKLACKVFVKDNTYIYPQTRIVLAQFNGVKLF